jgi:hypothetical protein
VAVVPNEPLYTWTFSRKSLLIRLYLWLYEADASSVNFCKLFWGVICSPVTLPVRLLLGIGRLVKKGLHLIALGIDRWVAPQIGHVSNWRDELKELKAAEERARKMRLVQRRREEEDAQWITDYCYGGEKPPPRWTSDPVKYARFLADKDREAEREAAARKRQKEKEELEAKEKAEREEREAERKAAEAEAARIRALRTPVTEKIAAAVALRVDKMVAWFQMHPQIGIKIDTAMTKVGRLFVRGVFYPLMIAIPLAAFSYVGYLIATHIHGPMHVGGGLIHGFASGVSVIWLPVLMMMAGFVVFAGLLTGVMWLAWKASKIEPSGKYEVGPVKTLWPTQDLRVWKPRRQDDGRTAAPIAVVYRQGWGHLRTRSGMVIDKAFANFEHGFVRTYRVLTPVGHAIGYGMDAGVWSVCLVGKTVRMAYRATTATIMAPVALFLAILTLIGRSTKSTGKFFVIGHHAVKYRTCPRIEITQDAS